MKTCMMVSIKGLGRGVTEVVTECGQTFTRPNRAAVFETVTAWPSLTTCPKCRARFIHDDRKAS